MCYLQFLILERLKTMKLAATLAFASFVFSCQPRQEATSVETGDLSSNLAGLTPEDWELYGEVLRFTPENLYEKINGRAEFYLAYDMVEMTFAGFEKSGDESRFVDVSVYDMGTPTHAFGVFSTERSHEASHLELGRDAYRSGANYYIWKGQYYIQIIAADATDELQRIGEDLARKTTDLVSDSGESVWGLDALPEEDRVPGSERYFLVDAMGLDFMRNTYIAQYNKDGSVVSAFLSQRDSPEEAQAAVAQYEEHANRYGKGVTNHAAEGASLISCDMGGSFDVVFQKGHVVAGVSEVEEQDVAILASVDLWRRLPMENDDE
jgi:hypothetical protein